MNVFKRDSIAYLLIVLGIAIVIAAPKGIAQTFNSDGNPGDNVSGEGYTAYLTQETMDYKDANNNSKPTTMPASDYTFTVSPEYGFSQNNADLSQAVTPGDVMTHEAYWVTNEGNAEIPLTRYFHSKMSTVPQAQNWTVEAYEGSTLLFTLADGTTSTSNDVIADNGDKQNHYVVYVNPIAAYSPDGSDIIITTTWESASTYAGQYTGANTLTYSGTTSADDQFTDSTSAPDLNLTRTATIDAPKLYSGAHEDAVPGAIITFTMTYSNEGSATAESVVLIDKVPDNTHLACINTEGNTTNVNITNGTTGDASGWSVYYFNGTPSSNDRTYGATSGWTLLGILTTGAESFPGGGTTYATGDAAYDDGDYVKWEKYQIGGLVENKKLTWGVTID